MIQCLHPYWRSNNREWIGLNSPLAQTAHPRPSLASCIRIKVKTPDPFMRHPGNLRGILTRWDKQAVNPEYDKARAGKF